MRPPWWGHSREEAELEALQTDIMRFMAILGLCLAAIFSLVQGAAQEQAAAGQSAAVNSDIEPAANVQLSAEPTMVEQLSELAPSPQQPSPPTVPDAPTVGFTLEFASVRALEALLQAGDVQLYARHRDQFWSVTGDGAAVPAQTPPSYYQMHTETVPAHLRQSVPGNGAGEAVTWGVTLPAQASAQIQRLTAGHEGGRLLIGADGAVTHSPGGTQTEPDRPE